VVVTVSRPRTRHKIRIMQDKLEGRFSIKKRPSSF
jgi:hypothetical protein